MIPKVSAARYAVRLMARISLINPVKLIYYVYFYSVIK